MLKRVQIPIRDPGPKTDSETGQKPMLVVGWREGVHFNGPRDWMDARADLDRYRVEPEHPQEVLAGDAWTGEAWTLTGFLSFDSEVVARALLGDSWPEDEQ